MKKFVILSAIVCCVILCSCTMQDSGYKTELTSYKWCSEFDGGGKVSLAFSDENATLTLENGKDTAQIKGKYIADDKQFIIFVPQIAQNYRFEYTPKGKTLDLKYNNSTVTLQAE